MSTTTHTPGPWVADFNGNIRQITDPSRPLMDLIVGAAFAPDELGPIKFDFQRNNARLIAAAPALLEALQTLLNAEHDRNEHPGFAAAGAYVRALETARAAIAATGE